MNFIKNILKMMTILSSFLLYNCATTIKNPATESYMVYGNCDTCKKTIETAANKKGEAKAVWDIDSKMLNVTYDKSKTNGESVLQRVADAGYDSERFIASTTAYDQLPECCQYVRPVANAPKAMQPPIVQSEGTTADHKMEEKMAMEMPIKKNANPSPAPKMASGQPLAAVYAAYFSLKDALVNSDATAAATTAGNLITAAQKVEMTDMDATGHTSWMKYQKLLLADAGKIKSATDIEVQRSSFIALSANMYALMKVVKPESEIYFDHCPMANEGKGADWLSKEKTIKNPYYGDAMLSCGKVTEILKK